MNAFITVENFINNLIHWAEDAKADYATVDGYQWEAFGAVRMATDLNPDLEDRLTEKWETEWQPTFRSLKVR